MPAFLADRSLGEAFYSDMSSDSPVQANQNFKTTRPRNVYSFSIQYASNLGSSLVWGAKVDFSKSPFSGSHLQEKREASARMLNIRRSHFTRQKRWRPLFISRGSHSRGGQYSGSQHVEAISRKVIINEAINVNAIPFRVPVVHQRMRLCTICL